MMLVKLLSRIDRTRFQSSVISLSSEVDLAEPIREACAEIEVLDVKPALSHAVSALSGVTRALRRSRPDVVQTWLYHADLLGGLAARRLGLPVVWNVRTSTLDPAGVGRRTSAVVSVCAWTSRFVPRVIVSCSNAAVDVHRKLGYADRFRVIPNGTDLEAFRPDPDARRAARAEFGLDDSTPVIGMVARFHPQKDYPNLLAAAGQLVRSHPQVRFVLCGRGLDATNVQLASLLRANGVEDHVILTGLRRDIPRLLNAFDIHTLSSSFGEGFPNVVGEAMATGVPCVVTDVGDSALIVGDTGITVPPRDPAALAQGWQRLLNMPRADLDLLRARARQRIADEFSLGSVVARYESLYEEVAAVRYPRGHPSK